MKTILNIIHYLARSGIVTAMLLSLGILPAGADPAGLPDDGAEILTRGPVHEAFAETIAFKPAQGQRVPRAAPALIEELPPDQRPEGANIAWIPGYWAWDDEGDGFIWVSGIWRNLPPHRQWMPGYWSGADAEYQWVSGYWADAAAEEVEYLNEPPDSLEAGPNIKAPSRDHAWMPGSWTWRESRYRWRPGYWEVVRPDWVWVPSYYVRSPRGYICVDGYYDYSIDRRGMIFAPVRFSGDYYTRPDYSYRPGTVISLAALVEHLFLRPRQRHYYFGDYYAPEYRRSGYYASYSYYSGGHGYDPIYAHNRWRHRDDDRWESRQKDNFLFFRENRGERPPHTLSAFREFNDRGSSSSRVDAGFATPLAQLAASRENTVVLKAVDAKERLRLSTHGREIRDFGEQRRKQDIAPPGTPDAVKPGKGRKPSGAEPVRVKTPRSPVAAIVPEKPSPADTPPPRPAVAPDLKPGKSGRKPLHDDKPPPVPDTRPDEHPGKPRPGPMVEPRRDPKPDQKVEPTRDPKPEPKVEPRRDPKPEPRVAPRRDPKPEPKVEPKRDPRPEPKVEPRRDPKPEPRVDPRRDPKPEPKVEPKRDPRPEPKVEPRRDPKPEPRVEPRRDPKPEPKVEPKRDPKPEPKRDPKPEPAENDNDKPRRN